MWKQRTLVFMLVAALAAWAGGCGDAEGDDKNPAGTDAGIVGGADAGEEIPTGGLKIDAILGLSLIDVPAIDEDPVDGVFEVTRDGASVDDAEVTINGVTVTGSDGMYFVSNAVSELAVAAGESLKIKAIQGGDTVELELPCPTDAQITSPADGTQVATGETITVTWSGSIGPYAWGIMSEPYLKLDGNEPGASGDHEYSLQPKPGETYLGLSATDTSGQLTIPENSHPAFMLKLVVPGDFVENANGQGYCRIIRKVHLTK